MRAGARGRRAREELGGSTERNFWGDREVLYLARGLVMAAVPNLCGPGTGAPRRT